MAMHGCEFQDTGFGVSLTLNAKFAGVGVLTEPFGGERKNVLKEKYLKVWKLFMSCMKGCIRPAHTNVAV